MCSEPLNSHGPWHVAPKAGRDSLSLQKCVTDWEALRTIPYRATATLAHLASGPILRGKAQEGQHGEAPVLDLLHLVLLELRRAAWPREADSVQGTWTSKYPTPIQHSCSGTRSYTNLNHFIIGVCRSRDHGTDQMHDGCSTSSPFDALQMLGFGRFES